MKFAHIADVHLGREQFQQPFRYRDYVEVFRKSMEISIREGVDFILLSGDFFHVSKPSPKAIRDAVEILSLAKKKDIPVFAIEGNHDKTIRDTSIYDLLEHLGLIYTLGIKKSPRESEFQKSMKKGSIYLVHGTVGDLKIYGLRHHSRWQLISKDGLSKIKHIFRGEKNAILMLHQAIDYLAEGTPYQNAFDLKLSELPDGFEYYALGHIHMRKELEHGKSGFSGDIIYPGSLERTEIREASHRIIYDKRLKLENLTRREEELGPNAKGFYIVEDFEPQFIEIETRPFYNITVRGNSKEELKRKLADIRDYVERDSIALVTLEGTVRGGVHVSEFYPLLDDWGLAYYSFNNRVTSEAVLIDREIKEEEFFTAFERELFSQLAVEPKEFLKELDSFLEWLLERYEPKREEKREMIEVQSKKAPKAQKVEKNVKKKAVGKLDAWIKVK
ncbi:hypothetical protein PAP_07730 [Palaeococcus pacificus DY20341]|uniref:DNA double-strand break repair protein Mre11 n=1 Tax=Palaeococcus pacificus DY20341 TaxID=1343739 RepID=A0A075LT44_9EURY|nr:exonuclease SbcCD subunit D [Palaeococcus pacificus]AIF69935.1 hypothetical protein PAP_07730 [Palaeococcus pacificus DY20341]